jgi:hypothetical protein
MRCGRLRGLSGTTAEENFDAGLLHSLVGPDDKSIAPAIDRYACLESYDLSVPGSWAVPGHEQIRPRSRVAVGEHLARAARSVDDFFGHEQLFLFDTRWAAAHPDLAHSLLRCATDWDPFAP